ncbi:hypothetical protein EWB00_006925 [Schistosoma japonicum]|uniref:Uncharacterized protein n=1 Tax=Schistosoma japonicum TaxID=6182 RepID=A0A4Z2CWH3_SCHJA|nr:hypothetical protein EWB00_006925 [Schistosoma japonicum]
MSSSFCSQDDAWNRSYQALNNTSPLSARFSKFLRDYAKEEESNDTDFSQKTRDSSLNKSNSYLRTSLTESSSGSLNTSFLSSQEATKRNNVDNNILKSQCTLIRNNLKLLKSQVDFLLKSNTSEVEGLDRQIHETLTKELESLLKWLEPNYSRNKETKQDEVLPQSPRLNSLSLKTLSDMHEITPDGIQENESKNSLLSLNKTCVLKTDENDTVNTNIYAFMEKMEDDFKYLANKFEILAKKIETFEQLNWNELLHDFRRNIQEQTVKMCISYIVQELDRNIFEP